MVIARSALRGLAAGAAATVPMTTVFWASRRARLLEELPPHKAVRSVAPGLPEPRLSWISGFAHIAIGGVAGAMYCALVPRRLQGTGTGVLFGLAVWAMGYEAVMPALTEIEPAHRDKRSRAGTILVAHVIYGAVLGLLVSRSTATNRLSLDQ